jgi:hypothetical protein
MEGTGRNAHVSFPSALLGVVIALLGFSLLRSGQQVVLEWPSISVAYAACGISWIIGAAAMIMGGLWVLGSLGRHRIALWAGALGSVLAGASLVIGVLTYVVPCSGPS